jgi:putative ABC transport system permease protein
VLLFGVSSWIALRPLEDRGVRSFLVSSAAIGVVGTLVLVLVTQAVLDMPRWFEPRVVVPLAGMIFAYAMNAVSLAAERLQAETKHNRDLIECRHAAMDAAVIPQINALLAVGLVSLPGMMTGQILSGVDPLVAVRYQIMVMCMIFGASGLSAAVYLYWMVRWKVAVH